MNRLVLSGKLAARGALRYTPAGLPALDLTLQHASDASHEGTVRKVSLEIRALALGELAAPVGAMPLGSEALYAGFLATGRNGRGLVFHLTSVEPV